ncbi:MAG: M20/M25/M40 family metallo-hydrolase [Tuberibacillus sp.]
MFDCRDDVLFLTKQLVEIPSVVNSDGEREISQVLYTLISSFPYFMEHPEFVIKQQTVLDDTERYNVIAFVKGTRGNSDKTVILIGHIDTVDIEDFGQLRDQACAPEALMEALNNESLPPDIHEQLMSGNFLFGRGALDMKSGLAANIYLLKYYSEHPDELEGNLVLVAECDEEDSSHGILSAVESLNQLKAEHHFDYAGAMNADFVAPLYKGDPHRYIYTGSVGKLLPTFFITGTQTHVGAAFEGLDPNYLASFLTKQINYNTDLCDEAHGEMTLPPVTLKQMDLKPSYDVQTAHAAVVYFNFFTHSWSPQDVLLKLKEQAQKAFTDALNEYKKKRQAFFAKGNESASSQDWQPKVLTFEEMEQQIKAVHGTAYEQHMAAFKNELLLDQSLDIRMFAIRVVEEAWKWMPDQAPAMIIFYSSLYSPPVDTVGKNDKEKRLLGALDEAVKKVQPQYSHPIKIKHFFPFISDMSFVALNDDEEAVNAVIQNNPAWGTKHVVRYDQIRRLNVPVINIGPYGFDAHRQYERVELAYSMEIVPNLINEVIQNVLK